MFDASQRTVKRCKIDANKHITCKFENVATRHFASLYRVLLAFGRSRCAPSGGIVVLDCVQARGRKGVKRWSQLSPDRNGPKIRGSGRRFRRSHNRFAHLRGSWTAVSQQYEESPETASSILAKATTGDTASWVTLLNYTAIKL